MIRSGKVGRAAKLTRLSCFGLALIVSSQFSSQIAQAQTAPATAGAGAQIIFQMDFPGQSTPHYKIKLGEDGGGSYEPYASQGEATTPVAFSIGATDAAPWFELAREIQFFRGEYAAKRKVAFTGTKTFSYSGPDGSGQTTFTYTENKKLAELTGRVQALALTLQLGQQLLTDNRFNRMAVDEDMVALKEALARHTAAYPQAIAPVLAVLADDTKVVAPVRRDATAILQSVSTVK